MQLPFVTSVTTQQENRSQKKLDIYVKYMEHHACYLNNTFQIFLIYTTNDHKASPAEV
jgi:hypothetical protein